MRIVLDTNVIVSALLWRGTPYRLFEVARRLDQIQLLTSAVLLEELAEVLLRPVPVTRLASLGMTGRQALAAYIDTTNLVTLRDVPSVVADDPDDDHVIAAAVAAKADLIVSGDKHLLRIGVHAGIRIVTPADAFAIMTGPADTG